MAGALRRRRHRGRGQLRGLAGGRLPPAAVCLRRAVDVAHRRVLECSVRCVHDDWTRRTTSTGSPPTSRTSSSAVARSCDRRARRGIAGPRRALHDFMSVAEGAGELFRPLTVEVDDDPQPVRHGADDPAGLAGGHARTGTSPSTTPAAPRAVSASSSPRASDCRTPQRASRKSIPTLVGDDVTRGVATGHRRRPRSRSRHRRPAVAPGRRARRRRRRRRPSARRVSTEWASRRAARWRSDELARVAELYAQAAATPAGRLRCRRDSRRTRLPARRIPLGENESAHRRLRRHVVGPHAVPRRGGGRRPRRRRDRTFRSSSGSRSGRAATTTPPSPGTPPNCRNCSHRCSTPASTSSIRLHVGTYAAAFPDADPVLSLAGWTKKVTECHGDRGRFGRPWTPRSGTRGATG